MKGYISPTVGQLTLTEMVAELVAFLAEDPETAKLRVAKGYLYIVWPHEPHKPLCSIGKAARQVRKIVVKVAVKESLIKHF